MNRSYVICHMMTSIDGKIDGSYMNEINSEEPGDYYDQQIFILGDSFAGGKNTSYMYHAHEKVDLSIYKDHSNNIDLYQDFYPSDIKPPYYLCFDRHGTCLWPDRYFNYANHKMQIVEVITKQVSKEYLLHLQHQKIAYIFGGDKDLDLQQVLQTTLNKLNIKTLILTGGALINGGFLKQNLIDEISLVVAPYIEGNKELKGIVELNDFINSSFTFYQANKITNGGVHLIFKKEIGK